MSDAEYYQSGYTGQQIDDAIGHIVNGDLDKLTERAEQAKTDAETAASHYPIIQNDTWWLWDVEQGQYVDSGISAAGKSVTMSVNGETLVIEG